MRACLPRLGTRGTGLGLTAWNVCGGTISSESRRRCCRLCNAGPGSVRRPPTTHAGNALSAHTRPLPRRLRDGDGDICQAHRCDGGFQCVTDHIVGSRREESLRARSSFAPRQSQGFAARRRAPTAVGGPSQDRRCIGGTVIRPDIESSPLTQSIITGQGCRSRSVGLGRTRSALRRQPLMRRMDGAVRLGTRSSGARGSGLRTWPTVDLLYSPTD